MADWSLARPDLARRRSEAFRPPPHRRARTPADRVLAAARRFADLQFGSIHADLSRLLPDLEGPVADIGCGAQPFRDLLARDTAYIGVDIAEAGPQFGYHAPDTRYYQGDALPLADGEAASVLCTETLEHVLEPAVLLAELRRVLAPGGRLVLTVPFAARWHFVPYDYWRYTPSGLLHLLGQAGFGEVRIYPRGGALAVAGYKVLGLILLMLSGAGLPGLGAWALRLAGVLLLPVAAAAALAGNLGLAWPGGGEDTLGYTVLARRIAS